MGLIMLFGHMATETGNGFQHSTANWTSEGGSLLGFLCCAALSSSSV